MTWQPIETAPKERWFECLVYCPHPPRDRTNIIVATWSDGWGPGWGVPDDDDFLLLDPTHWMLLPEPPTPSKTVKDE